MNLILETDRLLLRPLELSDAEAMFAMDKNPEVHKYLWQTPVQKVEEVIKVIHYVNEQYKRNNIGRFATILKETGEFIGWTGIKFVDDHIENGNTNFYDYGYRLAEPFWGKGYAFEAASAVMHFGYDKLKLKRIVGLTSAGNMASVKVLNRLGLQFEKMVQMPSSADSIQLYSWRQTKNVIKLHF